MSSNPLQFREVIGIEFPSPMVCFSTHRSVVRQNSPPAAANRYSKHAQTEPKNMNLGWSVGSAAYHLGNLLQVHSGDYFGVGLIVAGHVHTHVLRWSSRQSKIRTFWRKFSKIANMNDFAVMRLQSASCAQRSLPSLEMVRDDPEHMFNLAFKLRKTPQIDKT